MKTKKFLTMLVIGTTIAFTSQAQAIAPLVPAAILGIRLGTSMAQNLNIITAARAVIINMPNGVAKTLAHSHLLKVVTGGIKNGTLVTNWMTTETAFAIAGRGAAASTAALASAMASAKASQSFGGLLTNSRSIFSSLNNASGMYNPSSQVNFFSTYSFTSYTNSIYSLSSAGYVGFGMNGSSGSGGGFSSDFGSGLGGHLNGVPRIRMK